MNKNSTLTKLLLSATFFLVTSAQLFAQSATIDWAGASGLSTASGSSLTGSKTGVVIGSKTVTISYNITYSGAIPTFSPNSTTNRQLTVDWTNLSSFVTLTIDFSTPVALSSFPVNNVNYSFFTFNDRVEFTGSNGGNTTNNILQFGTGGVPSFDPSTTYANLTPSLSSMPLNIAGAPAISVVGKNNNFLGGTNNINVITNSTLPGVTKLVIVFRSGGIAFDLTGGNPSSQDINFLPFTISSTGTSLAPLPVTFANVNAREVNGKVAVNWSNLTESEISQYEVERSVDAVHFTTIASVSPKANNFSSQDYSFTDASPNSVNYYRIKAVEFNGTYKTSVILKVSSQVTGQSFLVYPNPVANKVVTIQTGNITSGVYAAQVVSTSGQVMLEKNIRFQSGASQSFELPANIRPGTYFLKIQNSNFKSVTTLFVQ